MQTFRCSWRGARSRLRRKHADLYLVLLRMERRQRRWYACASVFALLIAVLWLVYALCCLRAVLPVFGVLNFLCSYAALFCLGGAWNVFDDPRRQDEQQVSAFLKKCTEPPG